MRSNPFTSQLPAVLEDMAPSHLSSEEGSLYQPLNTLSKSIRLLEIRHNDGNPSFHLRQNLTFSKAKEIGYYALSYTWGPLNPARQIEIDGKPVTIRHNLYDFLMSSNPKEGGCNHLWIDQICIDQDSIVERNHQVSLMTTIYKCARRVNIWLGLNDSSSDLAIRFFRAVDKITFSNTERTDLSEFLDHDEGDDSTHAIFEKTGLEWKASYLSNIDADILDAVLNVDGYRLKPILISAFEDLMTRPYWGRLWILQEVLLAREISIICGEHSMAWRDFTSPIRTSIRSHPLNVALGRQHPGRKLISASHENEIDFHRLILDFSENQCQDPRDKIYGLRGLFRLWQRDYILVDYSKSVEEVYMDGILLILKEWSIRKQLWLDIFPYQNGCEALGRNMKPRGAEEVMKRLKKDMAALLWNEQDRTALKLWFLDLSGQQIRNGGEPTSCSQQGIPKVDQGGSPRELALNCSSPRKPVTVLVASSHESPSNPRKDTNQSRKRPSSLDLGESEDEKSAYRRRSALNVWSSGPSINYSAGSKNGVDSQDADFPEHMCAATWFAIKDDAVDNI